MTMTKVESFERITPQQVVEAYKATGLLPLTGGMYELHPEGHCACGIGVVYTQKGVTPQNGQSMNDAIWKVSEQELGDAYQGGFWHGFDAVPWDEKSLLEGYDEDYQRDFKLGYEDGVAARLAVLKEDFNTFYMSSTAKGVLQ